MPYVEPFVRMSFGGTVASGEDIWSCNVHLIPADGHTPDSSWFAEISAVINQLGLDVSEFVGSPEAMVPAGVTLDWLKLALTGVDGKYMEESVEIPLSETGGGVGTYIPQAAIVNTLISSKWKDPGKYNRFYLPVALPSSPSQWCLQGSAQTSYAIRLAAFVDELNAALNPTLSDQLAWVGVVSNTSTGSSERVEQVRLGRIVDTQRRRRNALTESYVTQDIST